MEKLNLIQVYVSSVEMPSNIIWVIVKYMVIQNLEKINVVNVFLLRNFIWVIVQFTGMLNSVEKFV